MEDGVEQSNPDNAVQEGVVKVNPDQANQLSSIDPGDTSRARIASVRFRQALYKLVLFASMVVIFVVLVGMIRDRWNAQAAPDFLGQMQSAHPLPERLPEFEPAKVVLPMPAPADATPDIQLSSEAAMQTNEVVAPKLEAQATIDEAEMLFQIGLAQFRLAESSFDRSERGFYFEDASGFFQRAADLFDAAAEANRTLHPSEAERLDKRVNAADFYRYTSAKPEVILCQPAGPPKPIPRPEIAAPIL